MSEANTKSEAKAISMQGVLAGTNGWATTSKPPPISTAVSLAGKPK